MIHKISTQTLESLHRLNNRSKDWKVVLASIKADRDTLQTQLINCDEESAKSVYQGMLRWINKFISDIENASTTLQKRRGD